MFGRKKNTETLVLKNMKPDTPPNVCPPEAGSGGALRKKKSAPAYSTPSTPAPTPKKSRGADGSIPPYYDSTDIRQAVSGDARLKDAIAGALYGVAVGDALGAPVKDMPPAQIAMTYGYISSMVGGGKLNIRPGGTTDETAMTLHVAKGISTNPLTPIPAIGRKFVAWLEKEPRDIGVTCRESIETAKSMAETCLPETEWKQYPAAVWFDASQRVAETPGSDTSDNGALIRCIYPALYYENLSRAEEVAIQQGQMTHWNNDSVEAIRVYTDLIFAILADTKKNKPKNSGQLRLELGRILQHTRFSIENMPETMNYIMRENPDGAPSYVASTLECALYAFFCTKDARSAIEMAVNMGGDADAVGSICGGIAGAFYGYANIPEDWRCQLPPPIVKRLDAVIDAAVMAQNS